MGTLSVYLISQENDLPEIFICAASDPNRDKRRMQCVCGSRKGTGVRQYGGGRHIAHSLRTQHILNCINPL